MKVYRSIDNSLSEVSKYKASMMQFYKHAQSFYNIDLFMRGVNSFFAKNDGCKFFFLYVEDAFRYKYNEKHRYPFYIVEYDIPESLLVPNIGLGVYSKIKNNEFDFIAIEFAIPIADLKAYENISHDKNFYKSKLITGNVAEIVHLGEYNETNYPFLNEDMKRESYFRKKEEFINYFMEAEGLELDKNNNIFTKQLVKQKVLRR